MTPAEVLVTVAYEAADNIESLAALFDEEDAEHIRLVELAKMLSCAADALSLEREE